MGDLGRLDEEGRLHLHGRADDVIISGGVNVEPEEVEAALESHPAIRAACVVGVPDAEWGQRVVATIVPEVDPAPANALLDEHLRGLLSPPKRPKGLHVVTALPLTRIGKIDRRAVATLVKELER
ncbi:AMP-binding enzyme [Litorihabitans aurantiacus]|uniref:AMP-binding enzyme C-terminal domain-containing protein n=1 Tax=Litorihabitans aurantiacus TaxID=1930061 RepID=A0AA37UQV8_9MICO|nr:hypothetical protein [Litorihabitans aurantiacus]GMA30893.1 hypothetical protein GCM10025875_08850 [Litorihabitans aurantiacus]